MISTLNADPKDGLAIWRDSAMALAEMRQARSMRRDFFLEVPFADNEGQ